MTVMTVMHGDGLRRIETPGKSVPLTLTRMEVTWGSWNILNFLRQERNYFATQIKFLCRSKPQ